MRAQAPQWEVPELMVRALYLLVRRAPSPRKSKKVESMDQESVFMAPLLAVGGLLVHPISTLLHLYCLGSSGSSAAAWLLTGIVSAVPGMYQVGSTIASRIWTVPSEVVD